MIEAVIFDMDGVIINSEPFWIEAEVETYNKYGIEMTEEMCVSMKGVKTEDVVKHWHSKFQWKEPSLIELTNEIIEKVIGIIIERGKAMPGLIGLLEYLQNNNIKIGLASSSLYNVIEAVLGKLKITTYFDGIHSAESEKLGKPAPDVYIGAARKMGVNPEKCIAIEDSYFGLVSAKSAGMYTVALLDISEFQDEKYGIANRKIKSLKEIIDIDFKKKYWLSKMGSM